jgi:hypothetical protein
MNKFFALLLLLGAIGSFDMATKTTPYQFQHISRFGSSDGPVRTAYVRDHDRAIYSAIGVACLAGVAYCLVRIRREDTRR